MNSMNGYWFPAKRFGWGWGLLQRAQSWAVLAVYAIALGDSVWLLPQGEHELGFFASVALLSAVPILVCWLKGEPPRWRWGRR